MVRHQIIVRPQSGSGFFDDANSFLKRTKIISTGLGLAGMLAPGSYGVAAGGLGGIARQFGYGGAKKRRAPAKKRKTGGAAKPKRRPKRKAK